MSSTGKFNVLLVGAGEVNFGSVEGPWNHTLRLEKKLGERLNVVGLVDPDLTRAAKALMEKKGSTSSSCYTNCRVFANVQEVVLQLGKSQAPRLVIIGTPPFTRGSCIKGHDLELEVTLSYPNAFLLVEKPVSNGPVDACWEVSRELTQRGTVVSVGYMLRYLKTVQKMKAIIAENKLLVMGTSARYVMAYEYARKLTWWDKLLSGGPIVEQATHFCDLSRYFGGDIVLSSVHAHTVEHDDIPGKLSALGFDESDILPERRLPRLTAATWKYTGGGVGSITHVIALHGTTYETEFEVYADGYRMKLVDTYGIPKLYVRSPHSETEVIYVYEDDDPFYTEISTIVDIAENQLPQEGLSILSPYEDALKTYEFTWSIRRASEEPKGLVP